MSGLLEAGGEARGAAADVREADRDRRLEPRHGSAGAARSKLVLAVGGHAEERTGRVVAAVEAASRAAARRERPLERVGRRRGGEDEVAPVEVAAEPGRAALERRRATSPPASCSKKSLIRFFSVSRSISSIFLSATAVWLATARARSTSEVPRGGEEAEQLVVRDERHGDRRGAAAARELRAELRQADRRRRASAAAARRRAGAAPRRGVEQVEVARLRAQRARARARRPPAARSSSVSARASVSASSVRCSSSSTRCTHLLVEARVLDRPGDERRARDEHLDLVLGELARRLGVAAR